jgi:hypothetical protein
MIVYLDTANLSTYASASAEEQNRFIVRFRNRGAKLALSIAHMIELRQHGSAEEREARYDILSHFVPIHATMSVMEPQEVVVDVLEREILAAALSRGLGLDGPIPGLTKAAETVKIDPFPHLIRDHDGINALREMESAQFGAQVGDMRSAIALGGAALTRQAGTPPPRTTLADLPDEPITPYDAAARQLQIAAQLGPIVQSAGPDAPITRAILRTLLQRIDRDAAVGPRRAAREELEGRFGRRLAESEVRRPVEELVFEGNFRADVRLTLDRHCSQAEPAERTSVAAAISVSECRGFWLRRQLEGVIQKAQYNPDGGNYWDVNHAMYYPYADRFFCDRRIATFISQVLNRGTSPAKMTDTAVRRNADNLPGILDLLS